MDLVELKNAGTSQVVHPWEQARLAFVVKQIKRISKGSGKRTLLEAGCGDGFVVSELAKTFPQDQFYGYDPYFEDDVLQHLRERYKQSENLRLFKQLGELSSMDEHVSIVTLLDVIEHIEDEVAALIELRKSPAITRETTFVITVPAHQKLFSDHDVFMKHFRRYNKSLLRSRLTAAGFEIVEMRYFFFSLIAPRWLQKRLEANKTATENEQKGVSAWRGGKVKTALFRNLLIFDWRLSELFHQIGIRLPGLSLICICRPAAS